MKRRRIILIALISLLICGGVFEGMFFNKIYLPPPIEYINLFNKAAQKELTEGPTHRHKNDVYSTFFYGDKNKFEYSIIVSKLNCKNDISFKKDLIENYNDIDIYNDRGYVSIPENFQFSYCIDSMLITSQLYVTFYGDSIKILNKNDSIASYYLKIKKFSVGYQNDNKPYIFVSTENSRSFDYTFNIMFLKKHNGTYLFIMHRNGRIPVPQNLLYSIVKT